MSKRRIANARDRVRSIMQSAGIFRVRVDRNFLYRYFTEDSRPYPPPPANTFVIGPCTGGFAAAAVSCSQTLPDLVSNGVQAVLVAFKTALRSFLVGQSLLLRAKSTKTQSSHSWSVTLSSPVDIDIEQVVNEYKDTKVREF